MRGKDYTQRNLTPERLCSQPLPLAGKSSAKSKQSSNSSVVQQEGSDLATGTAPQPAPLTFSQIALLRGASLGQGDARREKGSRTQQFPRSIHARIGGLSNTIRPTRATFLGTEN